MKKDAWHIKVRPSYYRGNFDYNEGPYNRVNRPGDDMVDGEEMIVTEEELEEIKDRDLAKKKTEYMKVEMIPDDEKYPDTNKPAEKNDIFKQDEKYYKEVYTNRTKELNKIVAREPSKEIKTTGTSARPKGKEKLAIIRGDDLRGCPFGLPIADACKNAGSSIDRMAPLTYIEEKEQKQNVAKANRLVYAYHKDNKRCPYADKILKEYDKVDCDFGDTGAGQQSAPFRGSPLYPRTFHGIGLSGLYGYPLGFYGDNTESRNLFFGLFSLLGFNDPEDLIKLADKYDKSGEDEKADILDKLLKKMQDIRENYKETFEKVEKYLQEYRYKYEKERTDTGLLYQLSDAWFGPRQINR